MAEKIRDPEDEYIDVHLANHLREDYLDIINQNEGAVPEAWAYTAETAMDTDPEALSSGSDEFIRQGMTAQAIVGFPGDHAVVRLPANLYAETPASELTEEAERVLLEWASHYRRSEEISEAPIDETA